MNITSQLKEHRTYKGSRVDALRFTLDGGVTDDDIQQLKDENPGYTEVLEHILTLHKPLAEEALKEELTAVAMALPDEAAVLFMHLYPAWIDRVGDWLAEGERVRHDGGLYRVVIGHNAQEHQPPSVHTASLYTRIQEPGSGPEPWVSGQSYAKGTEVIHHGGVWLSGVDNNIWEPGGEGVGENIWKRVRDA